jgi:hypothetical protein
MHLSCIDLDNRAVQSRDLGFCSSDWTRTSNHPINSPNFTQAEQCYLDIVRSACPRVRMSCLARLHVVGQLLDSPLIAFVLGGHDEEQNAQKFTRTMPSLGQIDDTAKFLDDLDLDGQPCRGEYRPGSRLRRRSRLPCR